ncbi:MAG: hypothetical protein LUE29_11275 [Lachnospiraceae bacterium]|nr:hypothetical protein [Lachnospiraceae bacterium]
MKEQKILLFDREERYREKLTEYVRSRQQNISFEFQVFTKEDLLLAGLEKQANVLCLAAGADLTENILYAAGERMILLDDGRNPALASRAPMAVKKYQKAGKIVGELEEITRNFFPVLVYVSSGKSEVIGVYSPVGRCGKTAFSLLFAKNMAKKGKTLLVSLDEFSYLPHLSGDKTGEQEQTAVKGRSGRKFHAIEPSIFRPLTDEEINTPEQRPDLGDLVCALDIGPDLFRGMLNRATLKMEGFDCVMPVQNARELKCVRADEWEQLLDALLVAETYEHVILDLGTLLPEVLTLLDRCAKIYMPALKERISEQKISDWESFARQVGRDDLILRSEKLYLPRPVNCVWEDYFRSQEVSEFGDFVRRVAGV